MGDSYRLRTQLGINQSVNVELTQDFEFLEVLSLKIQQTDIYLRGCADYGVIVGRVTANNGFGIPNARVSVFIPIESVDESNPIISSIYPYKSPTDKNEDGYRYNLLPYEKSYSTHAATGTFPSRDDVLTGQTPSEIYDKYYKFTTKTNESGDYMIMGAPLGVQQVVMDVDLSDIGEFSLTPQDLIRMGRATEAQVAGNTFKSSEDLNSLPQLVTLTKSIEVSPLWGDPTVCQIAVNRLDFDLRDDASIDIQPTAIFMGSIYSTPNKFRVRRNCRPRDNMGNLCKLITGPGQIIALRQTIVQDTDGNPIIEEYKIEQNGNVIDGDGTWILELPMNLEYVVTNEFGEKTISYDPAIGIPSKAKYRFKIKWIQTADLTAQTRRPIFLVPNVKEYGWSNALTDPTYTSSTTSKQQQASSYYFGLAWSGYTNGFTGNAKTQRLNEIIDGSDTFYEFKFNRVYTVAGLIDQWKKGAKGRFIGIKEIDDDSCENINKFPVNEGFRNFDLLFFIFSLLFQILQTTFLFFLIIAHIVLGVLSLIQIAICFICRIEIPIIKVRPFGWICKLLKINCNPTRFTIRLPMITYPDCETCQCKETEIISDSVFAGTNGVLSFVSDPTRYSTVIESILTPETDEEDLAQRTLLTCDAMAGNAVDITNDTLWKIPKSEVVRFESDNNRYFTWSDGLTLGERINLFNGRKNYFDNNNKIKVTFDSPANQGTFHYDNTITVLANQQYNSGDLLTAVDPATSTDLNFLFTATTSNGLVRGITGTTITGPQTISLKYATSQLSDTTVQYNLSTGSTITRNAFPRDREYYQVVTAITVSEAAQIWNLQTSGCFPEIISKSHITKLMRHRNLGTGYERIATNYISPLSAFEDMGNQYVLILQRGVDPYSPKFTNKYSIGRIFGKSMDDVVFTASTRINIPIQKLQDSLSSVQQMNQTNTFYQSYFFTPSANDFSGFTSSTVGYYGRNDSTNFSVWSAAWNQTLGSVNCLVATPANEFFYSQPDADKYGPAEDTSGMGVYGWILNRGFSWGYADFDIRYYSRNMYPSFTATPMNFGSRTLNVFRTDRLPSSDGLNGSSWNSQIVPILQQNNNFVLYSIDGGGLVDVVPAYTIGADQVPPDLGDLPGVPNVLESFNCENMVALECYQGFGTNFEINPSCSNRDAVERGCYLLLRRPLLDLIKDLKTYSQWGYRFRFFYGLCRGVLSQSFTNNWVNGSLYQFPVQINTFYNKLNQIKKVTFCQDLVYFDSNSNNFYYRSSPYNVTTSKFVGKYAEPSGVNTVNLLFPTTVLNLGMKDSLFGEIVLDPDTKGYTLPNLPTTSYGDTSDLVNLFVISRITDEGFLRRILSIGDNSLNQLFSRSGISRRVDGDLAQLMSINSEIGVVKFSPEYYETTGSLNDPINILGSASNPTMAVWFSSTTENLQTKDYLSPGRINFRATSLSPGYPFNYGIKSQVVPFYQWKLNNTNTIFGNQYNNWATTPSDLVQGKTYQSLDRLSLTVPNYFRPTNSNVNDSWARGYIFSVNNNGDYSTVGASSSKFIVGSPFHFYFGIIVGKSALDKFAQKYGKNE